MGVKLNKKMDYIRAHKFCVKYHFYVKIKDGNLGIFGVMYPEFSRKQYKYCHVLE
jgi:hypothetical protein